MHRIVADITHPAEARDMTDQAWRSRRREDPGSACCRIPRRGVLLVAFAAWPSWRLIVAVATTPDFFTAVSLFSLLNTTSFIGCVAVGMTFITLSGNIMSFALSVTLSTSGMVFMAALPLGLFRRYADRALLWRSNHRLSGRRHRLLPRQPDHCQHGGAGADHRRRNADHARAVASIRTATRPPLLRAASSASQCRSPRSLTTVVVAQFVLSFTRFGRQLYMVGSNWRAALAAGLEPARVVLGAYVAAGLCTAIAGILMAARYSSGDLELGLGYDYSAISAVLVGGTAISGGEGSAMRSLIGAFIIAVCQVLLLLHGFSTQIQYLAIGLIVLLVIMLQTLANSN